MIDEYELIFIKKRYSQIIRDFNENLRSIQDFRKEYPYVLPPNIINYIEDTLKDAISVLYRELDNIGKPNSQKIQYVCKRCKNVFLSKLPFGLCDQCRSEIQTPDPDM